MDALLMAARSKLHAEAGALEVEVAAQPCAEDDDGVPRVLTADEQAAALWSWVQGKEAGQRWDRPWTRERVADAHSERRRNSGRSSGITGNASATNAECERGRGATHARAYARVRADRIRRFIIGGTGIRKGELVRLVRRPGWIILYSTH